MHAWEEGGKVEVVNCVLVRLRELRVEEVKTTIVVQMKRNKKHNTR